MLAFCSVRKNSFACSRIAFKGEVHSLVKTVSDNFVTFAEVCCLQICPKTKRPQWGVNITSRTPADRRLLFPTVARWTHQHCGEKHQQSTKDASSDWSWWDHFLSYPTTRNVVNLFWSSKWNSSNKLISFNSFRDWCDVIVHKQRQKVW